MANDGENKTIVDAKRVGRCFYHSSVRRVSYSEASYGCQPRENRLEHEVTAKKNPTEGLHCSALKTKTYTTR